MNENGVLSFVRSFRYPSTAEISLDVLSKSTLIAPYWDDIDLRLGGDVFYRFTEDEAILEAVSQTINSAFNNTFHSTEVIVGTWNQVRSGESLSRVRITLWYFEDNNLLIDKHISSCPCK